MEESDTVSGGKSRPNTYELKNDWYKTASVIKTTKRLVNSLLIIPTLQTVLLSLSGYHYCALMFRLSVLHQYLLLQAFGRQPLS